MQAAPARYVSVSELYTTDEVELLLDEIRELEPTSCRGEDVQDFEIAGSGSALALAGGRSPDGRSPGSRSPAGTEHSWDSHAHYQRDAPPSPRRLAPLYCRLHYLLTLQGAAQLLLFCVCVAVCCCVWAAGGRMFRLPLAARFQLLLLAALTSALLHAALLTGHITWLVLLLPLDWSLTAALCGAWAGLSLAAGGGAALSALLAPQYRRAPPPRGALLVAGAALALGGAALGAALCVAGLRRRPPRPAAPSLYRALPVSDPH